MLAGYYSTIKKVQKRRAKTESPDEEPDPDKDITGAIFLAVCRGKVRDFHDAPRCLRTETVRHISANIEVEAGLEE